MHPLLIGDPACHAGPFANSLTHVSNKVPVNLSGPAKTMLSTLYLKALDADFDRPILGDTFAKAAIDKLDFDWSELEDHTEVGSAVHRSHRALRRLGP